MIDMFLEIGFKLVKQEDTEVGYVREYKYYPDYMEDKHYRLVRFTYRKVMITIGVYIYIEMKIVAMLIVHFSCLITPIETKLL